MTFFVRVLGALVVAGVLAVSSAAAPGSLRMVVFVANHGQGTVTSTPRGIHCPGICRGIFPEHSRVELHSTPAPGWTFGHFEGSCHSRARSCSILLVSSHDCIGGACPFGAFGVRAYFVRRPPSS